MPTSYTWLGNAGDNLATDPNNWSPTGVPQAGDNAITYSGTMDISGSAMSGVGLTATPGSLVELSNGASIGLNLAVPNTGAPQPDGVDVNIAPGTTLAFAGNYARLNVNATGGVLGGSAYAIAEDVTIAAGATLTVTGDAVSRGTLSYSGPGTLDLEGSTSVEWSGPTISTGAVIGTGTIVALGSIEINSPVASDIQVNIGYEGASVTLDQPLTFQGYIEDTDPYTVASARTESVLLKGLQATSYEWKSGGVVLYNGTTRIDTIPVTTPYGLTLTQDADGVRIWVGGVQPSGTVIPRLDSAPTDPTAGTGPSTGGANTTPPTVAGGSTPSGPSPGTGSAGAVGNTNPGSTTPPGATPSGGTAAAPSSGGGGGTSFDIVDMTTGQHSTAGGSTFTTATTDSLGITANAPSVFIQSGTGNDIVQATAGGNNVLADTGGQVNFEIGGSGTDTFFLDARNSPVTWNTIAGLHSGDTAIVYGISPQDLAGNALPNAGVTGYQGLTLRTFQNGGAAFLTLAGQSSLSGIASAFGKAPDGSSFLLLHAS